jgi:hypothetical protein
MGREQEEEQEQHKEYVGVPSPREAVHDQEGKMDLSAPNGLGARIS